MKEKKTGTLLRETKEMQKKYMINRLEMNKLITVAK